MFKDDEIRPIVDEVLQVCHHLKISSDPMQWSVDDTIKWLVYYIQLLKLNNQILDTFKKLSGQSLCNLEINDFQQVHAVDLYWKLQVWKKYQMKNLTKQIPKIHSIVLGSKLKPVFKQVFRITFKGLNFGTNHLHFEREHQSSGESDTKSTESFDLSETINMSWLDDDYNYTLTYLDDDLFKLDSSYHQNQYLPSLDDISLPSFYTNSLNSNFKLDSKDKDEIVQFPRLSTTDNNGYNLHSIYEFNYQLNTSNSDKCQQQSTNQQSINQQQSQPHDNIQLIASLPENVTKPHFYTDSTTNSNQIDHNNQESNYLTILQPQNIQQNHQINSQLNSSINNQLNNQVNNQTNDQISSQTKNQVTNLLNDHQIHNNQLDQQKVEQPKISSNSSFRKFQYQTDSQIQYLQSINNSIPQLQSQPPSLPSVASLKKNLKTNLSNQLNLNINMTSSNLTNLLNQPTDQPNTLTQQRSNQQLELNDLTNATIKIQNTNCLTTPTYYRTNQLHHYHQTTNDGGDNSCLNYHHHHSLNVQTSNQFISDENNNFKTIIDSNHNHQLTSSPSSISSSSNSSNSSPLPSLSSPILSPDNTPLTITTTTAPTTAKKVVVRASGKHSRNNIQLWQFLKELLNQPHLYENCIKWINRKEGEFRIVNSVLVANLWGKRKNRPKMNYDKLSRSIRQYYKKNIMIKTTKSQRLVYKFVGDYMK